MAYRKWWRVALAAGVVALVAAGCGSGGGSDSGASSVENAAPAQGAPPAADKPGAEAAAPDAGAPVKYRLDDRAIVYTGSITVRVEDVSAAAAEATSIATGSGGFVGGDKRSSTDAYAEATIVLRVPAPKFTAVVDQLAKLGDQQQRDVSTEDVTEEALDLDARISSQRARVDSGRRLLAQAKTLSELVMLEGELAKREADLASLEAKKRRMDNLTALSTITVTLLGPEAEAPVEEEETEIGFLTGLKGGWNALVGALVVLLTVVGALLPWLVALGLPVVGALWLARRLRRRRIQPVPASPSAVTQPHP
ncbi:DUF4349 domain-containing protein [Phytohabitans sp. ZYX-F-186]|uniref:DUF4349 domain-containing protein n=1 Tax=Phytohabitans maris TaxID=3071409 RepID=A0ABU0ZSR6_9ACTN|nr:DUF4349 domain-containing protein [Phytohabitans sp. ZYX-F-186]MDQ7910054.1 DUF4349 domain-containing protein [Phytohabitans sp. ZYX-F-186]